MTKERWAAANLSDKFHFLQIFRIARHFPHIRQIDIFTYELQASVRNGVHLKSRPKHPR